MSIWVGEIDLADLREPTLPEGFASARLLVRSQGRPLGWINVSKAQDSQAVPLIDIKAAVWRHLPIELARRAFERQFLPPEERAEENSTPISVVICTRDRPELLEECLRRLAALDYPKYEIIVVENVPTGSRVRELAMQFGVRYVAEDRPGLDWARNRGVLEATYEIVAFIDDDARADRGWLRALDRAFVDPKVMAVTGLVLPFELRSYAQIYFEQVYGGMGKGFNPRSIHIRQEHGTSLLWASGFGVGANMAFRRAIFDVIGPFDVALDVGTPARGGGDVEIFHRLVAKGHLLRYEPEAMVWHLHRREMADLRRQVFNNGCSVLPFLFTCWRNGTATLPGIVRHLLRQVLGWWILLRLLRPGPHSRSLILREFRGLLWGLVAYPLSRRAAARVANCGEAKRREPLVQGAKITRVSTVSAKSADE